MPSPMPSPIRPHHRPAPSPPGRRLRRLGGRLTALAAVLLLALPAAAYTIYLKDGSRLVAKRQYEVRGDKAYIVLESGTTTFIDLDEIDETRTREANQGNLGTALVIEDGQTRDAPAQQERPQETTLGDLIQQRREQGQGGDPAVARPTRQRQEAAPDLAEVERTSAGFPDLQAYPRRPFANLELGAELKQFFTNQGLDEARIFQGTAAGRPLVEVTTNSEASVFRALAVSASALLHLQDKGRPADTLELFLSTPRRERAGQFLLTPDKARALLSGDVDVATFYLTNVQF